MIPGARPVPADAGPPAPPGPLSGTRTAIIDYLTAHPRTSARHIAAALDLRDTKVLHRMEDAGQLVASPSGPSHCGRPLKLWSVAPPGTPARPRRPLTGPQLQAKRERERLSKQQERDRLRQVDQPAAAAAEAPTAAAAPLLAIWQNPRSRKACAGADPGLFFPAVPGSSDEQKAKAICASCPVRLPCFAHADLQREEYGIWGGVNFETERWSDGAADLRAVSLACIAQPAV